MSDTVQPGTLQTYQGNAYNTPQPTVPQKMIITDSIQFMRANTFAFLRYMGIGERGQGGGPKPKWRVDSRKAVSEIGWIEDKHQSRDTTTPAGFDDSVTTIPVADATLYRNGDILQNGAELIRVVAVASPTTLTVERGFGSTTAAVAAGDAAITYMTRANVEGADVTASLEALPWDEFNVVQNMKDAARISFARARAENYGINDMMADQIMKKFRILLEALNNAIYLSDVRVAGATDAARMMGGLPYYITAAKGSTIVDVGGGELLYDHVVDALKAVALETEEVPNLMLTDATGVGAVASWFQGSIRTTRNEMTGGNVVNHIVTPYGELDVLVDFTAPPGNTWLLNTEYIDPAPADPFGVYPQETQGDSIQQMIHGEYSFMCAVSPAHAHISNYDIS